MIYVKSFIYRLLIVLIIGMILFLVYRAIFDQMNSISMIAIVILALAVSPRFEVNETKDGQKLQMTGFPVTLMNWLKNLRNTKK